MKATKIQVDGVDISADGQSAVMTMGGMTLTLTIGERKRRATVEGILHAPADTIRRARNGAVCVNDGLPRWFSPTTDPDRFILEDIFAGAFMDVVQAWVDGRKHKAVVWI